MNLIVGDSHILALESYNNDKNNIYEYHAASIKGLLNENSKSQTGINIINLANSLKYDKLFIMFGKVDLEWIYPYKSKSGTIDFTNFVNYITDKYIEFINKISDKFKKVYVMGLHLPSLDEDDMLRCINSYNNNIKKFEDQKSLADKLHKTQIKQIGSLKKRTENIILFNNILSEKVNFNKNYYYIDIIDELLDKKTNTCNKLFINNLDHHLKKDETGKIWYQKHLKSLL